MTTAGATRCRKCGETDPARFHPSAPRQCKPCLAAWQRSYRARQRDVPAWRRTQRKYALKKRYGISPEQYEAMAEAQGWKCAICSADPRETEGDPRHMMLHVDHEHSTGRVRGLLCNGCNRAIGLLNESADAAVKLADYLRST